MIAKRMPVYGPTAFINVTDQTCEWPYKGGVCNIVSGQGYKDGLRTGDVLIALNGQSIAGLDMWTLHDMIRNSMYGVERRRCLRTPPSFRSSLVFEKIFLRYTNAYRRSTMVQTTAIWLCLHAVFVFPPPVASTSFTAVSPPAWRRAFLRQPSTPRLRPAGPLAPVARVCGSFWRTRGEISCRNFRP